MASVVYNQKVIGSIEFLEILCDSVIELMLRLRREIVKLNNSGMVSKPLFEYFFQLFNLF